MNKELIRRNVIILSVSMIVFFLMSFFVTANVNRNNTRQQLIDISRIVGNEIMEETFTESELKNVVNRVTKDQQWLTVCVANTIGTIIIDSINDAMGEGQYGSIDKSELSKVSEINEKDRTYILNGRMYYIEKLNDDIILRTSVQMDDNTSLILQSLFFLLIMLIFMLVFSIVLTKKTSRSIVDAFGNITDHLRTLSAGSYSVIDTHHKYEEVSEAYRQINAVNESIENYIRRIESERDKIDYIINNVSGGIMIIETNGNIYSVNNYAKRILGCGDEAEGKRFDEVIGDEKIVEMIETERKEKTELNYDYTMKQFDREYIVSLNCFRNNDNAGDLVSVVLYDVTDSRREERRKEEFIANAAHELKTPITSISGFSELLMTGLVTGEKEKKQYIANIYHEAVSMKHIIQELLYLSRLDYSDGSIMDKEDVDLSALSKHVVENFRIIARNRKVSVHKKLARATVSGNRSLLEHMITNLVDNAVKYSKENGGEVYVETGVNAEGRPYVAVKDNGQGIAQQDIDRLFERFYRTDTSRNRDTGGTGLGLTIVHKICALHGAEIKVESKLGEGSAFTVIFKEN